MVTLCKKELLFAKHQKNKPLSPLTAIIEFYTDHLAKTEILYSNTKPVALS